MKKTLTLLLVIMMAATTGFAQSLEAGNRAIEWTKPTKEMVKRRLNDASRTVTCGEDTVQYGLFKASGLGSIGVNNATSADQAGQYFDASPTNPITISGFSFYGWANAAVGNGTVDAICSVFSAGTDSLPTGTALATTTVPLDTNFFGGTLVGLQKFANFGTPVVLTAPFVMVIGNPTANSINILSNSWTADDGAGEYVGMASINGGWLFGFQLNLGGNDFNADWLIEPYATYTYSTDFVGDQDCLGFDATSTFTNTTDEIVDNRMYNLYAFFTAFAGDPDSAYAWDYGDGTDLDIVRDGSHTYMAGSSSYDVELFSVQLGYTIFCLDSITMTYDAAAAAVAAFSSSVDAANVSASFTSGASNADSVLYLFGDGNSSTDTDPTHTYAMEGEYDVTQIAYGCGGSDTIMETIVVCNLAGSFTSASTGLEVAFTNTSTSGTSYIWNFGDGSVGSTAESPTYTYASSGSYTVTLIVTGCGGIASDTIQEEIAVFPVGIDRSLLSGLSVYPNPSTGVFTLDLDLNKVGEVSVSVHNLVGQEVASLHPGAMQNGQLNLDMTGMQKGIYLLTLEVDGNTATTKISLR